MSRTVRLRYLVDEVDERAGDRDLPMLSVSIHRGVVPREDISDKPTRADDCSLFKVVRPGDLALNRMRAFQGAVGLVGTVGIVSPDYTVLRSKNVSPAFLHHLFRSHWFVAEMARRVRGIGSVDQGNVRTPRVNFDDLRDIEVDALSLSEQRAIADFLDAETARIDGLIDARELQRRLLSARLAASIERALWSENEGTGPALSVAVSIKEGQVDPKEPGYATMPLIAPNHVESGTGKLLELVSAEEQGATSGKYLCRAGDVVYSKIRPALRKACIAPVDCLTSADMYPLTPSLGLSAGYLLYFLLSDRFSDFAIMESERVAMPKINRDAFGRIRIPMRSVGEQEAIVERLDRQSIQHDSLARSIVASIALLQERKQALITAAVTGQLDLARNIAEEAS